MMRKQIGLRFEMHGKLRLRFMHEELRLRYKEYLESKLAVTFLSHPAYFNSVKKVSIAIVQLISANKEIVLNAIKSNPEILAELRTPYFGSIYDETEYVSSSKALKKILSVLLSENASLDKVMQIHCIFTHRIFKLLPNEKNSSGFADKLCTSTLFSARCRVIKLETPEATRKLGIANHLVFSKMLGEHEKKHLRALDKFTPDYSTTFFKGTKQKGIPAVCGPSGHTRTLLRGAALYGNFNANQLREYAFACFVFLAAGGNHSFYEVMAVANLIDADFHIDNYASAIPESVKLADEFKELERELPELSM